MVLGWQLINVITLILWRRMMCTNALDVWSTTEVSATLASAVSEEWRSGVLAWLMVTVNSEHNVTMNKGLGCYPKQDQETWFVPCLAWWEVKVSYQLTNKGTTRPHLMAWHRLKRAGPSAFKEYIDVGSTCRKNINQRCLLNILARQIYWH